LETPGRRLDLAVGILLGIVLGLVLVVLFVFLGSQETIDAPSIDHGPPAERSAPDQGRNR
jgi:hypothetical protein